jgi:hypothetical protein
VFIEKSSHSETCLATHLKAYLQHPQTIAIRNRIDKPAPRLFFQTRPGEDQDFSLSSSTCSNVIAAEFTNAEVRTDTSGAKVDPRVIRAAVYSRCVLSTSLKPEWIRHMQAWSGKDVQEKHYMRGKSPRGWNEFVLGYSNSVVPDQFVSLNSPPHGYSGSEELSMTGQGSPNTLETSLVEFHRQ